MVSFPIPLHVPLFQPLDERDLHPGVDPVLHVLRADRWWFFDSFHWQFFCARTIACSTGHSETCEWVAGSLVMLPILCRRFLGFQTRILGSLSQKVETPPGMVRHGSGFTFILTQAGNFLPTKAVEVFENEVFPFNASPPLRRDRPLTGADSFLFGRADGQTAVFNFADDYSFHGYFLLIGFTFNFSRRRFQTMPSVM